MIRIICIPQILLLLSVNVFRIMASFNGFDFQNWLRFGFSDKDVSFDEPFALAHLNVTYENQMNHSLVTYFGKEVGRYGDACIAPGFGVLYHVTNANNVSDHTGCKLPFLVSTDINSSISAPSLRMRHNIPWIALIKRGGCSFKDKVDFAIASNASGVIIYNDRESSSLDRMKLSSNKSNRNISAVFTYKWKGEELSKLVDEGVEVFVSYTISHSTSSTAAINRVSLWFVSSTFIILWILSISWLIFYYIQRFRYLHAKDRLSRHLCNAAKKALSKIPTKNVKFDDNELQGDGECCAICIEYYKITDILRVLPCNHEFHKNCIDPWLLDHRTCPMCKMDILKHYGFMYTNSAENILRINTEETYDSTSQISPLPQIRSSIIEIHNIPLASHERQNQETDTGGVQSNSVLCSNCLQNTTTSHLSQST